MSPRKDLKYFLSLSEAADDEDEEATAAGVEDATMPEMKDDVLLGAETEVEAGEEEAAAVAGLPNEKEGVLAGAAGVVADLPKPPKEAKGLACR